jgi:hypothetical protein
MPYIDIEREKENKMRRVDDQLTVKELREFINQPDLDENAVVYMERVEDFYFKENGWKTKELLNIFFPYENETNEYIEVLNIAYNREENTVQITPHY